MTRVWIALRFTKEQFKEIFKFDVDNCQEVNFTDIEDKYFIALDYDNQYVYLGEELRDEERLIDIHAAISSIADLEDEIQSDYKVSGLAGLYMFNSSWR